MFFYLFIFTIVSLTIQSIMDSKSNVKVYFTHFQFLTHKRELILLPTENKWTNRAFLCIVYWLDLKPEPTPSRPLGRRVEQS